MLKPTDRTLLVTHKSCLDGTGSALMFVLAGGRRDRVLFRNPSRLVLSDGLVADADEVWYADCCPENLTDPAAGRPFWVIDHHLSSQRRHGSHPHCVFDMERSGTTLMARELGLDSITGSAAFRWAMEDYDLGRFDNPNGVMLADLASTYSQEEFLDLILERYPVHQLNEILYDELMLARAHAASALRTLYAESAARVAVPSVLSLQDPLGDVVIAAVACPRDWKNDAAKRILDTRPSVQVAVVFDLMGGMVSLRSRPDGPDCSAIAGLYGGGGHARAAGFKIPGGIEASVDSLITGAFG